MKLHAQQIENNQSRSSFEVHWTIREAMTLTIQKAMGRSNDDAPKTYFRYYPD